MHSDYHLPKLQPHLQAIADSFHYSCPKVYTPEHPSLQPTAAKQYTIPRYSQKFQHILAKTATEQKIVSPAQEILRGGSSALPPRAPISSLSLKLPKSPGISRQASPAVSPRVSPRSESVEGVEGLGVKRNGKRQWFLLRVRSVGVGAHSFVYLVQQQESGLLLAQKAITKSHARQIKDQLSMQIKVLSYLEHENIIKLYHVYSNQTHVNLVMEYAEQSLFSLKQQHNRFPQAQILHFIKQLLRALQYMHRHRVLHADLKLENIMFANDRLKLCDFGLSQRMSYAKTGTHTHQPVVGTLEYLAPEYVQGIDSGPARDIWAVGILAFELSTGTHPFEGLQESQKWSKLIKTEPNGYLKELEQKHRQLGLKSLKVFELTKGIFVGWERRCSASQLLELPFLKD